MNESIARLNTEGLDIVGRGVATPSDPSGARSRQRTSVYADPLSWLVLDAVRHAIDGHSEELLSSREFVGHVVVSDHCTTHTMRGIAATLAAGRISPLRFSGANPGSVCSLPSQFLGFSGPSMTLSMPPARGLPPALAICRAWLREGSATHMLLTSHDADASGHRVTTTVLRETRKGD
ncbi:coronafacic acid synthetase [Streptomyces sp. W16]|uniref:coronafacic acid synthetase n=1 Tax=Streptomyces sp. W16 TaxID=3076631 RepID=UPI00295BA151|nr:coronafacic acid synthetase [Streptomyces sp. W16]MDV9168540.1 coronafacic acid synthetase [Streptomyces sp. W16]